MAAPHNEPSMTAADSNIESANASTRAAEEPKVSAGDSSLDASKATTKDTTLPKSMTQVLARPKLKAKSSKPASKKTGSTASKKASALLLRVGREEEETDADVGEKSLDAPDTETSEASEPKSALQPKSTKAQKPAPVISNFTGSMLPRIAATTTASIKAQYPDLNEAGEMPKRKRGEAKTQPAKKKGTMSATEEEKLWKPADPLNIQRPRCVGCQAVFCTCGYKPEYCSCTCWSCGRKAGGM